MKICFMWDAAQPFVISHLDCCNSHQARLVKYSVQQLQTIQNAAACPVFNLPKSPIVTSPHVYPHPHLAPMAAGGCSHLVLNSGPGIQGSSGSRVCISAGYSLSIPASLCALLCYNRPLSFQVPAAATSSLHLALTLLSTAP